MVATSRNQLNSYFVSEMESLRNNASQFGEKYPNIAAELAFSRGRSRDPHVEHLLQSFAWMHARLRLMVESESSKLATILLQQLYPQLVASTPSMSIAEFEVDGFAANFGDGYLLPGGSVMEPVNILRAPEASADYRKCRFSTCYDTLLWPLEVLSVKKELSSQYPEIETRFSRVQSVLKIELGESQPGAAEDLDFGNPIRFFIDVDEEYRFLFIEILYRHLIGVAVLDHEGNVKKILDRSAFKINGFDDDERIFPRDSKQELGLTLLHDYFSFPEKFLFFELKGFESLEATAKEEEVKAFASFALILNEKLPEKIPLNERSIKLNCAPVINLFPKTSEPIPISNKEYRHKLAMDRQRPDDYEIYRVEKVFSIDSRGQQRELVPYFSPALSEDVIGKYGWISQFEESYHRKNQGNDVWLSFFNADHERDAPKGETIFAETLCCNNSLCESMPIGQELALIGSGPLNSIKLISRPSRYRKSSLGEERQWQLVSHLSLYHVALSEPNTARNSLKQALDLYVNQEDLVGQRQIESIEQLDAEESVSPSKIGGWRGYYRGTKYTLVLNERKFEGSPTLFGSVLNQYLALFSHINSFSSLELKLGNERVFKWQPMTGHKILA